jgi:hypothetical protein
MSKQENVANGPASSPSISPRPSYISIEAVEAFLQSHAVVDTERSPTRSRRSPRLADAAFSPTPPIPPDASLINPPHTPKAKTRQKRKKPTHRPAPQISVTARVGTGRSANSFQVLADIDDATNEQVQPESSHKVTADTRAASNGDGARRKRGGTDTRGLSPPRGDRQVPESVPPVTSTTHAPQARSAAAPPRAAMSREKEALFVGLKERALAASSLDDLATSLCDLVRLMRDYRTSAPTVACFDALDAVQARLDNHHEFPRDAESAESFSALLTKTISAPVQIMSAQLQAQHKALQGLTKSIESVKTSHMSSGSCNHAPAGQPTPMPAKSKATTPLTNTPDERILLRCDGDPPQLFSAPYHDLVPALNAHLTPLGLPPIVCASRSKDGGLFLVPGSKEAVVVLVKEWERWGTSVLPGTRIVPPAIYSHIQVDGIPHAAAPDLEVLAKELAERYPELGPVVGRPVWVNLPPSEAQVSAALAAGKKPRTAGSIILRLTSRAKVDIAVSLGRLRLAGSAPTVVRGFPHLRISQCWGCYKFGHIKARCTVKVPKCGGCGEAAHSASCVSKPVCLNCGGDHRADAFSCPTRKRVAESLRNRAVELTAHLNATSSVLPTTPAPRLPDAV